MSASKKDRSPKSLIITLHLPRHMLSRFAENGGEDDTQLDTKVALDASGSAEKSEESAATPAPASEVVDPTTPSAVKSESKKKRPSAAANGRKRAPPMIDPNGPMREIKRPAPKKPKRQILDGSIDQAVDGSTNGNNKAVGANAAHKLGPKANMGAINAGLRALDRSGKPCRKWERKGLQIKSFTGVQWGTSTWKTSSSGLAFSGDVKSDSSGSSDLKPAESSVVVSERSHSQIDGDTVMTNGVDTTVLPSSPMAMVE